MADEHRHHHDPTFYRSPAPGAAPGRRRLERLLLLPVVTSVVTQEGYNDMSITDDLLANNERYAESFHGPLPLVPSAHLAVVACMDSRMRIFALLGLEDGQAHIIRNAGGVVTDDVIRSLTISQRLLATRSIILIHHTECGMLTFTDDQFKAAIAAGDRHQAAVGRRGLPRPGRRCPAVHRADQVQPVHPVHRRRARLRLRRRYRAAARGEVAPRPGRAVRPAGTEITFLLRELARPSRT